VRDALKQPSSATEPPDFRILRPLPARGYPRRHATSYAVETEPGIFALVTRLSDEALSSRPPRGPEQAVLYVADQSSDAELRDEPLVRELLAAHRDVPFYACDVRGIGESRPDACGADQFRLPYGSDYFYAIHSIMLDRPYVGQKTHDVLRVIDWLAAFGHRRIHLAARGWGALPATFAALLAEAVEHVTLKHALTSYAAVAETEDYDWPLSAVVPEVLLHFDLPDCYRVLEKRKALRQIDPRAATSAS
jgi:pimeloyl-ACP methyl ester carboxylesterase